MLQVGRDEGKWILDFDKCVIRVKSDNCVAVEGTQGVTKKRWISVLGSF